jgi:hypothetical protein
VHRGEALVSAAAAIFPPMLVEDEEEKTEPGVRPGMRIKMISISVRYSNGRSKELRVKDTERNRAALGALQRRR